jgi:c-di-AMP phosphodiesterase-like protein
MGHRFSDLDCIGSAIGLQCVMEKSLKRYCKIIVDKQTSMAKQLINYADEKLETDIFTSVDVAMKGITPKTLLIILDTHIKDSLESKELYEKCKRVIVIDHHRKAVNYIDNALVFCHEPSASSTSEMCSEIISCMDDKPLGYVQADALLSGIMLDTKNFVIKTGVRTFESAAYLRKKGANTLNVKEMFSDSIDTYKEKVDIVCKAHIYKKCAVSVSSVVSDDIRLAAAQAADEMLSIQGVNASFVLFEDGEKINISARSYGRINVQLIMEKLGGGGHQTMAAAQLYDTTKELAYQELLLVIDDFYNNNL